MKRAWILFLITPSKTRDKFVQETSLYPRKTTLIKWKNNCPQQGFTIILQLFSPFPNIEKKVPGVALIWPTRLSWTSIFSILFLVPEYPEHGIQPMFVSPSMDAAQWSDRKETANHSLRTRPDHSVSGSQPQQKQLRKKPLFFLSLYVYFYHVSVSSVLYFLFL